MPDDAARSQPRTRRNALEWATVSVGVLLTAGVVGLLVWDAVAGGGRDPEIRAEVGAPRPAEAGGVLVPLTVHNDGGQAGEDVQVEVCAGEGPEADCAEATFPFVPRGAQREAMLPFDEAPGPLRAKVRSYRLP